MKVISYTLFLFLILVLFILISHYIDYTRINIDDFNIQQCEQPNNEVIEHILKKKQPTLFLYELELWSGIDLLIGQSYDNITQVFQQNHILQHNITQIYLKPYNLPLTKTWNIKCIKINNGFNDIQQTPTLEHGYNHLICSLSGLLTICFIHPKHKLIINQHSNDFKNYLSQHSNDIEHITIPIRPSHMVYIPYGWYYYIYCGQNNNYCAILDCQNITYFQSS